MKSKLLSPKRLKRAARRVMGYNPIAEQPSVTKDGYPNWAAIVARDGRKWKHALNTAKGPRVLVATSLGGETPPTIMESTLAAALTLRGARVDTLLCDAQLPACQLALNTNFNNTEDFLKNGPMQCGTCFPRGRDTYSGLGIPIHL